MLEVVAALLWDKDTCLICQRNAAKSRPLLWEFPGGKVEPGETPQEALVRECREELGVTIEVKQLFAQVTHTYPDVTVHIAFFHAVVAQGTLQALEHNATRWVAPNQAAQYAFCPADAEIVRRLPCKNPL